MRLERLLIVWLGVFVTACGGDSGASAELTVVEGLPSVTTHQYSAWEQGDHLLIGSSPWEDRASIFTLAPESYRVVATAATAANPVALSGLLFVGDKRQVPIYFYGNRLWRYDPDAVAVVDMAPQPEVHSDNSGAVGAYFLSPEGNLVYVDGSVQIYHDGSDSWTVVVPPDSLTLAGGHTFWQGRFLSLTETGVVEVTEEGFTALATCEDECEELHWNRFHHPDNGELWIQDQYRWWSFDGTKIRSLGSFPNPVTDLGGTRFISQVMTAAVLDERIYTVNRERYTDTYGVLLSWKPGAKNHHDHEIQAVGTFVGSSATGLVLVPYTRYDFVLKLEN